MELTSIEIAMINALRANNQKALELAAQIKKEQEAQESKLCLARFMKTIESSTTLGDFNRLLGSVHRNDIAVLNKLSLSGVAVLITDIKGTGTKTINPVSTVILEKPLPVISIKKEEQKINKKHCFKCNDTGRTGWYGNQSSNFCSATCYNLYTKPQRVDQSIGCLEIRIVKYLKDNGPKTLSELKRNVKLCTADFYGRKNHTRQYTVTNIFNRALEILLEFKEIKIAQTETEPGCGKKYHCYSIA